MFPETSKLQMGEHTRNEGDVISIRIFQQRSHGFLNMTQKFTEQGICIKLFLSNNED